MITKEDIIHWFEALKNKCDKVTTGNCSHEVNSIRFLASNWADKMKKEQGETMFYHNFIGISEVCVKITSGNLAHHIATIKSCLLYTSPSPRDGATSRMPSSA